MTPPSGEQIEITRDGQQAVVEVGGGLRSYAANGRELLDGYGVDSMSTSGRGQVLSPWPNRLRNGRYEFDGKRYQLPLTEPTQHNAIHGLVRWSPRTVTERAADRVVVQNVIHPQPGYPLRVVSDGEGIPTGAARVEGTPYDYRRPRLIEGTRLDNAFSDLERDGKGVARVELRHEGRGIALWMDEAYGYVMVFSGDPLPDVNRRSLAVEPMTCPPNAFSTGEALVRLQPGEPFTAAWGISPC
jgi:aldose 1-epimerase